MGIDGRVICGLQRGMSEQIVSSGRTPRIRSCRKRSYNGDEDSSPEVKSSTSKKPKPPSMVSPRAVKTPVKKPAGNLHNVRNDRTPVGATKKPTTKTSKKGRPKREQKSIDEGDSVVLLRESPAAKAIESRSTKSLPQNGATDPPLDNCTFEQRDTWPLKYSPNVFGNFVGNKGAVEKVERWLLEWKIATKKNGLRDSDSNSSNSYQQETSSSALFIKGPPGVGKTSLVYYLAKKLGFTVLEVNSSSERPGKRVLADLHEATQSQHVEGTKVAKGAINAFFKPTLTQSPVPQTPAPQTSMPKTRKKSKVIEVKERRGTLKNFFTPVTPKAVTEDAPVEALVPEDPVEDKKTPKSSIKAFFAPSKGVAALQTLRTTRNLSESPEILTQDKVSSASASEDGKIKCSSSTIILFDDVDVVFDDDGDEGFWMALETVLKSSKKPCILTATRGYDGVVKRCRSLQNAPLVELHRPSPSHVASLITNICAAEDRDLTDYNVEFMCQYLASDVRRSLIQMEFETVSSGLLQTVYPANKTMGGLMTLGCTEDALGIQIAFKKVGFNALYASLEDCLPFEFEDILLDTNCDDPDAKVVRKRPTKFESETVRDLARIFEEFSMNDSFMGCLTGMGEECLPSYERAKRWMKQRPMESQDTSQRVVEELLELSSIVLVGETSAAVNRISERFAALDAGEQSEQRLCRVTNALGFQDIHKQLKKVRVSESCLDDILQHFPIRQRLAFDYLGYLKAICCAENEKREKSRRGNRFNHYLSNIGVFLSPEQLTRISEFWS